MKRTLKAGRNLLTPHAPENYPGLLVVKPGPDWDTFVIVPEDGETVVAVGGESVYGYHTVDGGHGEGFFHNFRARHRGFAGGKQPLRGFHIADNRGVVRQIGGRRDAPQGPKRTLD